MRYTVNLWEEMGLRVKENTFATHSNCKAVS